LAGILQSSKSCYSAGSKCTLGRSRWLRGIKCGSAAARLLGLWVRTPLGAWISHSRECCCTVTYRSLRRADHSSRGVLPNVVCLNIISNFDNDDDLPH